MNSQNSFPWDLASLIGNAASLHVLCILIANASPDRTDLTGLLIWWAVLTAAWVLMYAAGHRIRSAKAVPGIAVCALVFQILLVIRFAQPPASLMGWLWMILIWGIPLFRATEFLYKPESPEQRMLDFEFCLLSLILLVLIISAGRIPPSSLPPVLFACALTLLNLAVRRNGSSLRRSRFTSSAGTLLIPALLILAGVLLMLAVSGPLSIAVNRIVEGILSGIHAVLSAAGRFFTWLFSLLPQPEPDTVLPEAETAAASAEMTVSDVLDGDTVMTPILLAFIGCCSAALLLMGSRRFRPLPVNSTSRRTVRLSPAEFLRRTLHRLRQWIHFRIDCFRYRNTPEGLLCRLEFAMAARHAGRRRDESPRSFLTRTARIRPDLAPDLQTLADWIDLRCFSEESFTPDRAEFLQMKKHITRR